MTSDTASQIACLARVLKARPLRSLRLLVTGNPGPGDRIDRNTQQHLHHTCRTR